MPQCCDKADFQITMALPAPIAPRVPADGAPNSAYFQLIETVARGLELNHAFEAKTPTFTPGPAIPEDPGLVGGAGIEGDVFYLEASDECDRPILAFGAGVILSGTD
jgi:hypothetical protein